MGKFWKQALGGVVLFFIITTGVFVGALLALNTMRLDPAALPNSTFLSIDQPFPDYKLSDVNTQGVIQISELLRSGPLIAIFMSPQCSACDALVLDWTRRLIATLKPTISAICIYDEGDWYALEPKHRPQALPRALVMTMDRRGATELDGIRVTPTIVGLNEFQTIRFVSTGFDRRIDAAFINHHL